MFLNEWGIVVYKAGFWFMGSSHGHTSPADQFQAMLVWTSLPFQLRVQKLIGSRDLGSSPAPLGDLSPGPSEVKLG